MGQGSRDKLAGLVSSISTMCQTLLTAPDAELLKESMTCWLLLAQHWQTMAAATAAAHWHMLVGFSVMINLEIFVGQGFYATVSSSGIPDGFNLPL